MQKRKCEALKKFQAESCAILVDICIQKWDVDIIHTEVEQVVYKLTIADLATGIRMKLDKMFPIAAILKDESFLSDVDAFKNDMSKAVMVYAEAFFDLVRPAWESTVLQQKQRTRARYTRELRSSK